MCTEHCSSIAEMSWKSCNQFLKLCSVKITLEIAVNSSKQGFYLISWAWLSSFLHVFLLYLTLRSLYFSLLSLSLSLSTVTHASPYSSFSAVRFSAVSLTLIQFRTKSQNAQPCRLPFSMTPLTITIYPEFCGILYVFNPAHDTLGSKCF